MKTFPVTSATGWTLQMLGARFHTIAYHTTILSITENAGELFMHEYKFPLLED